MHYSHSAGQYILCPYINQTAIMLIKVESIKLKQVGLNDFLANTRIRRLQGDVTIIKKYFVIKFLTVSNTNKVTVNILLVI